VAGNVVGVIVEAADKPGNHGYYSKIKKRASTFIVANWELGPDSNGVKQAKANIANVRAGEPPDLGTAPAAASVSVARTVAPVTSATPPPSPLSG
jgi:hypothetical protein